jgi:putative transposase
VRIVRRADGYYCQFCVDINVESSLPLTGNQVGLDVGLESFYVDSFGRPEPNPRFARKAERKIKFLQRRLSKKPKKTIRRLKAKKQLAKNHLRVSRQRTEYAKRLALRLCQSNDLIAYEDLNVKGLAYLLIS